MSQPPKVPPELSTELSPELPVEASAQGSSKAPAKHSTSLAAGLWQKTRRVFILIAGSTVILIGLVLLVTPGPAMLVIPLGLAILATEFVWAKRLLQRIKDSATSAASAVAGKSNAKSQQGDAPVPKPGLLVRLRNACSAMVAPFRTGYISPYDAGSSSSTSSTVTSPTVGSPVTDATAAKTTHATTPEPSTSTVDKNTSTS